MTQHHSHRFSEYLPLILSILFIGTSGPLGRLIPLSPIAIIFLRSLVALLILLLIIRFSTKNFWINDKKKRILILLSGVFLTVHWDSYFFALQLSSVAMGMLSMFTYPVMTVLLEPLYLKRRLNAIQIPIALIALTGIYIMLPSFDIRNENTLGILMGLLSAFMYAARNLLLKRHAAGLDETVVLSWQVAVVVLLSTPFLFLFTPSFTAIKSHWHYLLFLGVVTTAMGHTFFIKSLRHFSVSTVSILSNFTPVVGILLGIALLGEKPSENILIGGTLILLTALLEVWLSMKRKTINKAGKE